MRTTLTPEEEELEKKAIELENLEQLLSQKELELVTLQAELHTFEQQYLQVVGIRLAKLDEIEARIAELFLKKNPTDQIKKQAAHARARADGSADAARGIGKSPKTIKNFVPSDKLKRLYRDIAKQIHPDLADDENERELRNRLMADANKAFRSNDEKSLNQIIEKWQLSPESVKGEGVGKELIRTIRKIAQVEGRLDAIEKELIKIAQSDLFRLRKNVIEASLAGRDLLAEIAEKLDIQIERRNEYLDELMHGLQASREE
jgi:hypothetical protein